MSTANRFALLGLFLLILAGCTQKAPKNQLDLVEMDIATLQQGYETGHWTVSEVVAAYLTRIDTIDHSGPTLASVLAVHPEAMRIADSLDQVPPAERGPLHGVPVLLKDNIDTFDLPTTAGSRALEGSIPAKDSEVARKLRAAGAVILGKANLSEWANFRGQNSTSGWSGLGQQTKNPYDILRNPCGSSSGSGVAVSANLAMAAIGTETNGSIVCPANASGVVGLKPTVGLISRSGIIPISWTQDTAGPMTRTLADAALLLNVLTGPDPADEKTLNAPDLPKDYTAFLQKDGLKGKRIGWFKSAWGTQATVDTLTLRAIERIKELGAEVIEIESINERSTGGHSFEVMLYEYKDGLNKYFASLGPDARIKNLEELIAFNLQDSIELKYFNQEYLERALAKGPLTDPEYLDHLNQLKKGSQENGIDRVMNEHELDAIIAPTGSPAWATDWVNGDNYHIGTSSPAAWAGYPNITIPMGHVHGLPVGLSFFGRAWSEPVLIECAYAFEQSTKARIVPQFKSGI